MRSTVCLLLTNTVTAEAPLVDARSSESGMTMRMDELSGLNAKRTSGTALRRDCGALANVQSLQHRAAGVPPVGVEVPRTGTSHRFVKPLVVEEETVVSFRYKRLGR